MAEHLPWLQMTTVRLIFGVLLSLQAVGAQGAGTITGTVVDAATGQPVAGVHVSSTSGGPGSNFVGALTGRDGVYRLENVSAGAIHMILNVDGYKMISEPEGRATFPLHAGETLRRDFVIHPQSRIYGRLLDRETGKPITGHAVLAVRIEAERPAQTFTLYRDGTQTGDQFNCANLDPGDYFLEVEPDVQPDFVFPASASPKPAPNKVYGQAWYPGVPSLEMATPIHVSEGESRRVDISLRSRETHSLSGVISAPRDLQNVPITIAVQSGQPLEGWVAEMPTPGSFRIDNLPPGKYQMSLKGGKPANKSRSLRDYNLAALDASGPGVPPAVDEVGDASFEIEDHDVDEFKASLAPYAGVAGEFRMLEQDAKLPPKLGVAMVPVEPGIPMFVHLDQAAHDGRFRQAWLHPGTGFWPTVIGLPKGYAVAQVIFDGATAANSIMTLIDLDTPLTFVLTSRPGAVTGGVHDPEQNPVRGATILLLPDPLPQKPDPETLRTQTSGQNGRFSFTDLAPGKYRAVLLKDGDRPQQGDVNFLRQLASDTEPIEVTAGQATRVDLKQ